MYQTREIFLKCHSPCCDMSMNSTQNPELVMYLETLRCFNFVHTQVLDTLYIPIHIILFLHVLIKTYPG